MEKGGGGGGHREGCEGETKRGAEGGREGGGMEGGRVVRAAPSLGRCLQRLAVRKHCLGRRRREAQIRVVIALVYFERRGERRREYDERE